MDYARTNITYSHISYTHTHTGFLPTTIEGSRRGNYALMDIIAALHWVHDNIAEMGGDAGNITLVGHDRGAAIANLLMISPMARGEWNACIYGKRIEENSLIWNVLRAEIIIDPTLVFICCLLLFLPASNDCLFITPPCQYVCLSDFAPPLTNVNSLPVMCAPSAATWVSLCPYVRDIRQPRAALKRP